MFTATRERVFQNAFSEDSRSLLVIPVRRPSAAANSILHSEALCHPGTAQQPVGPSKGGEKKMFCENASSSLWASWLSVLILVSSIDGRGPEHRPAMMYSGPADEQLGKALKTGASGQ